MAPAHGTPKGALPATRAETGKASSRRFRPCPGPTIRAASRRHAELATSSGELLGAPTISIAHDERWVHHERLGELPRSHGEDAEQWLLASAGHDLAPAHETKPGRTGRGLHAFALVPRLASDEGRPRGQPGNCSRAIGFDATAMLEAAGRALHAIRFGPSADGEIGRRAGDEVEGRLSRQDLGSAKIADVNLGPMCDTVPGERASGQSRGHRLRLDTHEPCRRETPGEEEQDAPDAAPEVEAARRRTVRDQAGGKMRNKQIVEGGAVAVRTLEDSPVTRQPAQILLRAGPQRGELRRDRGLGPIRCPAGRSSGGAQDATRW